MEEEDAQHGVAVDAAKGGGLAFGQDDEAQDKGQEECQHGGGAQEAFLLAHGAEDEVRVLLGDILQLGLRAVEEALARQAARADGYLGLVDVVARAAGVFFQAQEHLDAHLLVALEDAVEDVVAAVEEADGAEGEADGQQVSRAARLQGEVAQVADGQRAESPQHPHEIERHKPFGHRQGDGQCPQRAHGNDSSDSGAAGVDPRHARGEEQDEGQHQELAQRRGRIGQHDVGIADAQHEVEHGADACEEDEAGHPLAVEHEEEGEIDQRGAGLALQDDEQHGHEDEGADNERVLPRLEHEAVDVHALGQGQGGGKLGKLGGLQADRAQDEPRARPLGVRRDEDGDHQEQDEDAVDEVGKGIVEEVVQQQHCAQAERADDPHELLAGAGGEVQQVVLAVVVAGAADADPAERYQQQVDDDGGPVDSLQD